MKYLSVKLVEARPMTALDAHKESYKTGDLRFDTEGYEITYPDGYKSWCPKDKFEESSRPINGLSFGHAIEAAKKGFKISRACWNGRNMFVVVMPSMHLPPYNTQDTFRKVNDRTAKFIGKDKPLNCLSYLAMYDESENWIPGWVASQPDMLAEDWQIME